MICVWFPQIMSPCLAPRCHPATGTYSSVDLSVCSPALLPNFSWKVDDDSSGSDHFPIFITEDKPSVLKLESKWKLSKANWNTFQMICEQSFTHDKFTDCDDPTQFFTSLVIDIAK